VKPPLLSPPPQSFLGNGNLHTYLRRRRRRREGEKIKTQNPKNLDSKFRVLGF
jgi:hypothetical protein